MPLSEEQRVSNLVFFLRDRPDFVGRTPDSTLTETFRHLAQLEAFLWLHTCVQAEYFPRPDTRRVAYEYFQSILKSYEYVRKNKLGTRFSSEINRILDLELTGRTALFEQREGIGNVPDEVLHLVQSLLLSSNGFVNDLNVEYTVDWLSNKSKPDWDDYITHLTRELERQPGDSPRFVEAKDAAWVPLLRIIEHMESVRHALADFDASRAGVNTQINFGVQALKERLKQVQSWRLDFKAVEIRDRFNELIRVGFNSLRKSSDAMASVPADRGKFDNFVHDLMTDWGAPKRGRSVGV